MLLNILEIRDFDGSTVKREYNALNRPSRLTDQEGKETLLSYDVMWNLARITEPNGAKTTYVYNSQNRLERVRRANGAQVRYTYDAAGNRTGVTDEEGNQTRFAYDACGRLIQVTDAEGADTFYEYDPSGNLTKLTDACGNTVTLVYDVCGRLVKETNVLGESRCYTYTSLGKPESVTDEAGRTTRYEYEPGGRLRKIRYPDGTGEAFTYDGNGNVRTHTRVGGNVQSYEYDSLNRIVKIQGSGGESKTYAYDAVGNVIRMTDSLGNSTHYGYTLTGKLKKVTDALGNEAEYDYDACGRLMEIRQYGEAEELALDADWTQAQEDNREARTCQITRYERDLSGQVTKITDALGREEQYTYGKRGELLSKLDKDGYLTAYGYTEKGDLSRIRYADGREVRLSYNPLRQLEEMEDWLGITRIENDALGRAVKVRYPEGQTVSYTYGKTGERTSLTYPDGRTVTYGYDELVRLTELKDGEQSIRYAYNAQGRLEEKEFPGGITSHYAYDSQGRLESLIHRDREGILDAYAYKYDVLGNKIGIEKERRGIEEESGSYAYGYDALGRLSRVTKDGSLLRSYAYDAFGNRIGLTEGGKETRYTYNALNQLVSLTDEERTEQYIYDKRGNLTELVQNGSVVNRYLYGTLNRLEKAVNGEGAQAFYRYNGLGYRIGKAVKEAAPEPERQIRYTIDLTRQYHNLLEKEEEGERQRFLWDGNAAGVRRISTGGIRTGSDEIQSGMSEYYLQDELGSPIRLMGEEGEVTESYGYDEFGRDLYGNQGKVQPFGYTGYQYDRVSGTYFAQAREYGADVGRFTKKDTFQYSKKGLLQSLNLYGYCMQSPLNYVDGNGHEYIVVSGSPASTDAFDYQFIETGIKNINDAKAEGVPTEDITWMIVNAGGEGYTSSDIANFQETASKLGVGIQIVNNKQEIIDYINNKDGGVTRAEDRITNMTFFSHGQSSIYSETDENQLAFGYGVEDLNNEDVKNTNFTQSDIASLDSGAFCNTRTVFYSCNAGTKDEEGNSFAQTWSNKTGGVSYGIENGRTYYGVINWGCSYFGFYIPGVGGGSLEELWNKAFNTKLWREKQKRKTDRTESGRGYSKYGCLNYPCLVSLAGDMDVLKPGQFGLFERGWKMFTPCEGSDS